jgi:predicted metal-binding membrane protein
MPVNAVAAPTRRSPAIAHAAVALPFVVALCLLAWLALAVWSASPWQRLLDHGNWSDLAWLAALCRAVPAGEALVPALAYALAWLLMIAAMMLPTTLPLLALFRRIATPRRGSGSGSRPTVSTRRCAPRWRSRAGSSRTVGWWGAW